MIKISLGILVGLILFIVLCWGGCRGYTAFEQRHLVRRAVGFLGGNNYKEAALCARRALQMGPSLEASRIMAQIGERTADRTAIDWRQKVVQLVPNSGDDQLALAATALQFNDAATGERALKNVPEKLRDTAGFHAAAGRLADAKKNLSEAQEHWRRAVALAPNDRSYQLQFALARLRADEPATRDAARADLENLRGDEQFRAAATRALIADGVTNHERTDKIRVFAKELQAYPEHTFTDRLLFLDLLRQLHDTEFTSYLTAIEADAASNAKDLSTLLSWMNGAGLSALALDYSRSLPPESIKQWPVPLALAESYTHLSNWNGLEKLTKGEEWNRYNFLRRAYLARAYREMKKDVAAEHEWGAAVKEASAQPETLSTLIKTVSDWGWKKDAVDLLWTLAKFSEKQREALQALYRHFNKELDSQGLYRVTARLAEIEPEDLTLQNNLAQISLLVGVDTDRARKIATNIYQKEPTNAAYASTYAFSLFSRGDAAKAVAVMDTLGVERLRKPEVATYYGVFLAGAGDARAPEFLALADSAKLLPEEKTLVDQAKKRAGLL